MRYINEIKDSKNNSCKHIVIGTQCMFTIRDSENHEVVKYNTDELTDQDDYLKILGVDNGKGVFHVWTEALVMFKEMFEELFDYIGSSREDIFELPKCVESNGDSLDPVEQIIFDELMENKLGLNKNNEIEFGYAKDFKNVTKYYSRSGKVKWVEHKDCIYQNINSNTLYISSDGDVYVRIKRWYIMYEKDERLKKYTEHFKIKDVGKFKKTLAKIKLLYS